MNIIAQARCEGTVSEAADIKTYTFRIEDTHEKLLNDLQPGRHVAIQYPDSSGDLQQRLYSITNRQETDTFEITVKRSGRNSVSDHMHATLTEGCTVPLEYVAGDISAESVLGLQQIGLLAGGIGITLPIALLRELAKKASSGQHVPQVVLMLCTQKVADIPFLNELLALELTSPWFTLHIFVTQEKIQAASHFKSGRPTLDTLHLMNKPQAIVICGSHSFATALREQALAIFPSAKLLIESFTPPETQNDQDNEDAAQPVRLSLSDSEEVIETFSGKSLLEILESFSAPIRSQCRVGICGNCRIRVSGGESRFEPDFCLSEQEKSAGYALACCTYPLAGNISLDLRPTI